MTQEISDGLRVSIGRVGLEGDVPLWVPAVGAWDGDSLQISTLAGGWPGQTPSDGVRQRDQLLALMEDGTDRVVAFLCPSDPTLNAWVYVTDVKVKTEGASIQSGVFPVQVSMVKASAGSRFESLLTHVRRPGTGVGAGSADPLVGVPPAATTYRRASHGLGDLTGRAIAPDSGGGEVLVDVWADTDAQASAFWTCPPGGAADGAARLRVGPSLVAPAAVDSPLDIADLATAFDGRDSAPVKILCVGDGITEGTGATSIGGRWVNLLQTKLRTYRPTAGIGTGGGVGYLPSWYGTPSLTDPVRAGSPVQNDVGRGLGFRELKLSPGDSVTWTVVGTDIRVRHATYPDTDAEFSVTVDGGTPTVISQEAGSFFDENHTDVALGASGSHTVTVAHVAGTGTDRPGIEGIEVYDGDAAKGIRVYDAARHGLLAANVANTFDSVPLQLQVEDVDPDLVVIELGAEDLAVGIDPAAFRGYLDDIVDAVRTGKADVPILVVAVWERAGAHSHPWSEFVDEMADAVADGTDMWLLDMTARWPKAGSRQAQVLGYYADDLHLSPAGHQAFADIVHQVLTGDIVEDRFNRADDAEDVGDTDTGQTWTQTNAGSTGHLGILNGQLYCSTPDPYANLLTTPGPDDGYMRWKVDPGGVAIGPGLLFRFDKDLFNGYLLQIASGSIGFFRIDLGAPTGLGDVLLPPIGTYDILVTFDDDVLTLYVDGEQRLQVTDATYTSGLVGASLNDTAPRLDDFQTGPGPAPDLPPSIDEQLAAYRAVVGRHIPGDVDPNGGWCLDNGLYRVYPYVPFDPSGDPAERLIVEAFDPQDGWVPSGWLQVEAGALVYEWVAIEVTSNTMHEVAVALIPRLADDARTGLVSLIVRRGDRNLLGFIESGGTNAVRGRYGTWSTTGLTEAMQTTSDDDHGNRAVLSTAQGTFDAPNGFVTRTGGDPLDFGFAAIIGGSTASGIDAVQALANQYAAAVDESVHLRRASG